MTAKGRWTGAGSLDTMRGVYRPSPCQGAGHVILAPACRAVCLVRPPRHCPGPALRRAAAAPAVGHLGPAAARPALRPRHGRPGAAQGLPLALPDQAITPACKLLTNGMSVIRLPGGGYYHGH